VGRERTLVQSTVCHKCEVSYNGPTPTDHKRENKEKRAGQRRKSAREDPVGVVRKKNAEKNKFFRGVRCQMGKWQGKTERGEVLSLLCLKSRKAVFEGMEATYGGEELRVKVCRTESKYPLGSFPPGGP